MASSTGNIKQAYDVNGEKIYPKVILDAIEGEGGKTGMEIIKEAVGGIGMESLKGVSVEYDDIGGNHHLVFKSHYEESAGGYIKETIVGEGPLVIGNYSKSNQYADDHIYVSKNLSILGDANTLEFAADADAVTSTSRNISGKIAHTNNSIQIINNNKEGKLELFGGGEGTEDCVSISASLMNIPKNVSILKNLSVSGNTTVATTSGAKLSVGGNAEFSNTITVNGKSSFKDGVSLEGQTASRGSSPKLSFTSYENKTNPTNRATGYIVEHYGDSNNTSLEMYDVSKNNAHLSLSGSDKTFTVKVNSNNSLILDGSSKVAKIQPYSSDENSPSLVIDGSKKTTTLKSDNNTKLMLDASNAVLYGDSYRYMELNGSNGEINLNASEDKKTYLKLDGTNKEINLNASEDKKTYLKLDGSNGEIDLWADANRFLSMPKKSTEVKLCSYRQGNVYTYLKLDGSISQPYTKLSALRGMYLGMNDTSGNLRLQAKGGTFLMFDVSGNNNSVRLQTDASSYLQIDAISKEANLYADVSSYLQIDASSKEANLYANDSTYLKLLGGTSKKANLYADASSYLQINAKDKKANLYADASSYLQIDASSKEANLYVDDSTYLNLSSSGIKKATLHADASTYLNLLGGITKKATLHADASTYLNLLGGITKKATLYADASSYLQINAKDKKANLYADSSTYIEINSEVVKSSIPMTAEVNDVPDVYVGCPIGTIVMWPAADAPSHWVLCGTKIPVVADKPSGSNYLTVQYTYGTTYTYYITSDYSKYFKLIKLLNGSDSSTIIYNSWKWGGTQGSPLPIKSLKLVDVVGRFPLAAKDGSINNGYNEDGNQIFANTSLGTKGGSSQVNLSVKTMPSHSHSVNMNLQVVNDRMAGAANGAVRSFSTQNFTINNTGGDLAHSNMPPYIAINFIIKYE